MFSISDGDTDGSSALPMDGSALLDGSLRGGLTSWRAHFVDGSTDVGWLKKSLIFWRAHAGDAGGGLVWGGGIVIVNEILLKGEGYYV